MALLSKEDYEEKYIDPTSGLFKPNGTKAITASRLNEFVTDTADTLVGIMEGLPRTQILITKVSHGFVAGNVLTLDGSGITVKVSDVTTDKRLGVVTSVVDVDSFYVCLDGYATGLSGFTPGTAYYATNTGILSATPSEMPVLVADTSSSGFMVSAAASAAPAFVDITGDADDNASIVSYVAAQVTAAVVGLYDDRGNFDASVNAYPSSGGSGSAGAIMKGDIWRISVAGTLPTGLAAHVGDSIRALVDTPGNTQANWSLSHEEIIPDASDSTKGIVELATPAEVITGTDTSRATTAEGVHGKVVGVQDIFVPAVAMWGRATNGAAPAQVEMTTSLFNVQTLDFDTSTQEYAQFQVAMPRKWNNGTVTAEVYWTAASGSGGVVFGLNGGAYSNDDALTVAFGTSQTMTDTLITANDLHITPTSSAITLAGTPATADLLAFQLSRVVSDGSDTLGVDARVIGVMLHFTTTAAKDA